MQFELRPQNNTQKDEENDHLGWSSFTPDDQVSIMDQAARNDDILNDDILPASNEPNIDNQNLSNDLSHEQDTEHLAESFLDYNQALKVIFEQAEEGITYDFDCEAPNDHIRRSILSSLRRISSIAETENPDIYRLSLNDTIFVDISKSTGAVISMNKLTAFETRLLAQGKENDVPFSREKLTEFRPSTDLHTHLAGALKPDDLINIGRNHNATYPISKLEKMGIDASQYTTADGRSISMSDLSDSDLKIFKDSLMLPLSTQETFTKMEEIYDLRGPLTKNKELMPDFLWALANDYRSTGVQYAELSFSSFLNTGEDGAEWMQILEDYLPDIEEQTGVKLRIVAGLWRHSDKEWSLDDVDRLTSAVAKSPYIVGCDFMGHETNKTTDFEDELRMLSEYSMQSDPNFTIRVHAGENPIFDSNVRDVLRIIYDEHKLAEERDGVSYPYPNIRIGHGLYGVDDETLGLAKEIGAIIEFNMSSNLALNNVDGISEIPIKRYLDKDVDVVLGTDGHGLYSTFGEQEIILATAAGLTERDFEKMRMTEQKILAAKREREATHPHITDIPTLYKSAQYSTEDGAPRWNDVIANKYKQEAIEAETQLIAKMNSLGIIADKDAIAEAIDGKTPILITGASKGNWKTISDEDQDSIRIVTQALANVLNPETAYFVTGGTNFGAEKTVHEAVYRRNQESQDQLVCWGTLTMDAAHDGAAGVMPNTVTHVSILETKDGRKVKGWKNLPDTQIDLLGENGEMIALGGGDIVKNMIQRAHNLGVNLHLMNGPKGASTSKSHALIGHGYSFETPQELIKSLYRRNPQLFLPDFSLEQLDAIVTEAEKEISAYPYSEQDRTHGQSRD